MSIKIYHGPPGSYKTSSMVKTEAIPAILSAEPIVTNIRGINIGKVWQLFGVKRGYIKSTPLPRPENQYFISLSEIDDTVSLEVKEALRYFFLWCPRGTNLFIDEAQLIFPKAALDIAKDFKPTDYTKDAFIDKVQNNYFSEPMLELMRNSLEINAEFDAGEFIYSPEFESRPMDLGEAIDRHRHFNFNLTFTMPNIAKLHDLIRTAAEGAYRHRNQAVMSSLFKGLYMQYFHEASTAGRSNSDIYSITTSSIPKRVFQVYDSTTTGVVMDTKAGGSALQSSLLLFLLLLLSAMFFYMFVWSPVGLNVSCSDGDFLNDITGIKPVDWFCETEQIPVQATNEPTQDTGNHIQNTKSNVMDVQTTPSVSPVSVPVSSTTQAVPQSYNIVHTRRRSQIEGKE